jgi:hypothetical protein
MEYFLKFTCAVTLFLKNCKTLIRWTFSPASVPVKPTMEFHSELKNPKVGLKGQLTLTGYM